jgi:hypothetical protein
MIIQLAKTFVDEDDAEVTTWDIDLTSEELNTIDNLASCNNGSLPSSSEGEEPLVFRGKTYDDDGLDITDLLDEYGKRLVPDHTIDLYVY